MEKQELQKQWLKFKKAETKAKNQRVEVELELVELFGSFEGNSKSETDDGFKTSIKKNVVYKLDQDKWFETRKEIDPINRPEKVEFKLDIKGFEYLKANNKDVYIQISDCVTIKENKSTVKVEKI